MFGRRKQDSTDQPGMISTAKSAKASKKTPTPEDNLGKGRPTPKRKVAEAANRRPIVPGDRKEAAKAAREKARLERIKQQQAMMTGDERHMPPRDRGPQRRYIRNFVDARTSLSEFLLPFAIVMVVATFFATYSWILANITSLFMLLYMLALAIDLVITWQRIKRRMKAKFSVDVVERGSAFYFLSRAISLRPMRLPKPQVKRGNYPS